MNDKNARKGSLPKPANTATPLGSGKGKAPAAGKAGKAGKAEPATSAPPVAAVAAPETPVVAEPVVVAETPVVETPPPAAAAPAAGAGAPAAARRVPVNKDAKMTPRDIALQKVAATGKRFARLVKYVEAWPETGLVEGVGRVGAALTDLRTLLAALPATYAPPRGEAAAGASKVVAGALVALRERVLAQYDDVLDPGDRAGMRVESFRKGRVVVRTKSGEKIVLPRGHVAIDEAATALAVAEAEKVAESKAAAARADQSE